MPDAPTIRLLSVLSSTDPRTVARFIQGKPVRPMIEIRIRDAMSRIGMTPPAKREPRS